MFWSRIWKHELVPLRACLPAVVMEFSKRAQLFAEGCQRDEVLAFASSSANGRATYATVVRCDALW